MAVGDTRGGSGIWGKGEEVHECRYVKYTKMANISTRAYDVSHSFWSLDVHQRRVCRSYIGLYRPNLLSLQDTLLQERRYGGGGGGESEGSDDPPFLGANFIHFLYKVLGQRSVKNNPFKN